MVNFLPASYHISGVGRIQHFLQWKSLPGLGYQQRSTDKEQTHFGCAVKLGKYTL
jgi:hypothetical protein